MTAFPKVQGEGAGTPWNTGRERTAPARGLIACSRDAALARALQELAAAEAISVTLFENLHGLTDELMRQSAALVLLDAAALDEPLDRVTDAITAQFPDIRLLVAGQVAEQNLLATRIARQAVFRFIHKPVSPQRLKLFFDAAAAQPAQLRMPAAPAAIPATAHGTPLQHRGRGRPPRLLRRFAVAVMVLAAATAASWWWVSGRPGPAAAFLSSSATPPAIHELLQRADAAYAAGHFVASDGSSAAELYGEALRLAPHHREAASGYARAIESGLGTAEEALLAGRVEDAGKAAAAVGLIAPDNTRLAFLNTQIARETERLQADASQRQAQEARQARIGAALALMRDSLQRGDLTEPQADSALTHFLEAEAAGANVAAVRAARETLLAALLTAADTELGAHRPDAARGLIAAAESINSSAPGLDVVRRRVEEVSARLAAEALASAIPPPAPVVTPIVVPVMPAAVTAPPEPPPPETPPAPVRTDGIVPASSLRVLHQVEAQYPRRALDQLISGWVEMEFTVTPQGAVEDVVVTRAEPAGTFDAAAAAALRGYRYAPVLHDGAPAPQRARMRMRFTAQDER